MATGDGKLIKLSLIYPSPRGRPTHGISHSSIFILTLYLIPSSTLLFPHQPFCRYLRVALFPLLFVSLRFRSVSHAGFETAETKRAKHFNLASRYFHIDIHFSVALRSNRLNQFTVSLVLSARRWIADTEGRRHISSRAARQERRPKGNSRECIRERKKKERRREEPTMIE